MNILKDTFDFVSDFIISFHGTCQEEEGIIALPVGNLYIKAKINSVHNNRPRIRRDYIEIFVADEDCIKLIYEDITIDYTHNAEHFYAEWQKWKEIINEKIEKLNIEEY